MKTFLTVMLLIYIGLSCIGVFAGLIDSTMTYSMPCEKPTTRLGSIFPSYRLGCWLGEVPSDSSN